MTIVIGLLGPAGSGKSTVSKHLAEKYGAKIYSLASPLKAIAHDAFGFSAEQLYGTQEQKEAVDPRYGMSCRQFLQRLGTEGIRRHLGADVWIQACLRKIKVEAPNIAVVDDLRFINEGRAFRDCDKTHAGLFGYVWRLVPPEDETTATRAVAAGKHQSEYEWMQAPYDSSFEPEERGVDKLLALIDTVIANEYPTIIVDAPKRRELSM